MSHVNHAKTAKLTAADPPAPTPTPEPPRPALGYLPRSFQRPLPRQPPPPLQSAAPAGGAPSLPTASVPAPSAASPSASQLSAHGVVSANGKAAPSSSAAPQTRHPAPAPANENSEIEFRPRRSAWLNPQAYALKSAPPAPAPQSLPSKIMARTYPISLPYNQCLGAKEGPYSFSSVYLEDLRNDDAEYLSTVRQLIEAIPKTLDPNSRFALRGQVTPSGNQRLCHSMRAAPLRRSSQELFLPSQGRRNPREGGEGRLRSQPIKIQCAAQPPQ